MLDLDALRLKQLTQELPVTLIHLLNQVVDVGAIAIVKSAELLIEVIEFIGLLEWRIQHVHGHMQIKRLIHFLFLVILIVTRQLALALFLVHESKTTIVVIIGEFLALIGLLMSSLCCDNFFIVSIGLVVV